jgi:hypothetical protein
VHFGRNVTTSRINLLLSSLTLITEAAISSNNRQISITRHDATTHKTATLTSITVRNPNFNTVRFMFSVITNTYNKKTKGSTLMELFTATGKLKKSSFYVRTPHHCHVTSQARIIAAVKNIDASTLTRVW